MSYYCENLNQNPNSNFTNNNNNSSSMDPQVTGCSSKSHEDRPSEDHSNLNDENVGADSDNSENSDEMFVNSYDADWCDDDKDIIDDVQLSSPSNSDVDQRWYAFRGRFVEVHNENRLPLDNQLQLQPQLQQLQPQEQEEEETDFLEMDFEPETNSEIENEAKFSDYVLPNGHHPSAALHFHNHPLQPEFLVQPKSNREDPENLIRPVTNKNTGAKPKQLSAINRPQKPKHVSDGDNVFKISTNLNNNFINSSSSPCRPSKTNEVYNLGASSSRSSYHNPHSSDILKIHKSPSKSSNHHHNHKHLRLHEEQNDQFLFEIEPIKPRNSVTIYTTNCDEKILLDALTSLNLNPNLETISSYFNRSKSTSEAAELNLVDYIIHRSKINCNYLKLVELIQKTCKIDDEYSDSFEVNFYPLDLFSTTPEMVEVEVAEIVKRWTPQTDLSLLINIRNKYFYQTNVLGKIVNIIRKINQKPPATFKDKETIKIPQFYVSGYITITCSTSHGYKSS